MANPEISLVLTWTPAETALTEIASYDVLRSIDGEDFVLIQNCPVVRDFLGGLLSIQHCDIGVMSEDPGNPEVQPPGDYAGPIRYVDDMIEVGRQYCYRIRANVMGNRQSVAQGPPSTSEVVCNTLALIRPDLTAGFDDAGTEVVLQWGLPVGEFYIVSDWKLFRSVNGSAFSLLADLSESTLGYADADLPGSGTVTYYVVYMIGSTTSPQSEHWTVNLTETSGSFSGTITHD